MRETVAPVRLFGQFIKSRRLELGLTQKELAALADIAQGYLSRIEKGEREPTVSVAIRLCDTLDLNIDDFAKECVLK